MTLTIASSDPAVVRGGLNRGAAAPAGIPVLTPGTRHFARRWSGGITPALSRRIVAAGGARAWFAAQLYPSRISDSYGDSIDTWWSRLDRTPAQIFQRQKDGVEGAWIVMADMSRWTVARQIHSSRQVQEQMVSFWSNLLHVPIGSDNAQFWRRDYDLVVRRHALDTFENLLLNTITHPAMGLNLNNAESTKDAPNENLGRELLELHTVGIDGGYTEDDVKDSARILTGYRVYVWWPSFKAVYVPGDHWVGQINVLGFTHANAVADGRAAVTAYLKYLAHHPKTANRIARRLCVKFGNENPSGAYVDAVAKAYLDNGTEIRPTLLALVGHPEFTDSVKSQGAKVRTPLEDYVATVRALGLRLQKPLSEGSFANAMHWQYTDLGQAPYDWPAPNGFPEVNAAWSSAGRILTSFDMHRSVAARYWPTRDVLTWSNTTLMPPLPATLQKVVDTVGIAVLGQVPGPDISKGIATVLAMSLSHHVTAAEATQYWFTRRILISLLDSPIHLHR